MKKVIILRGNVGTGKSSYLKNNFPDALVCSADHFFLNFEGVYKFNPNQLATAHKRCMRQFVKSLYDIYYGDSEVEVVAVDNTNITTLEWFPYYRIAEAFGFEVEIVQLVPKDIEICRRNVHGVPFETIKRMAARFEKVPDNIRAKITTIEV